MGFSFAYFRRLRFRGAWWWVNKTRITGTELNKLNKRSHERFAFFPRFGWKVSRVCGWQNLHCKPIQSMHVLMQIGWFWTLSKGEGWHQYNGTTGKLRFWLVGVEGHNQSWPELQHRKLGPLWGCSDDPLPTPRRVEWNNWLIQDLQ